MMAATSRSMTATTAVHSGPGKVFGARLVAAADAATAILRDSVDGSGPIIAKLGAGAALAVDDWTPAAPVVFHAGLHVTITGTTPQFNVFI
jgi:hypothetical protein